uniref:DUF3741 domain-containing protein n=1 Tax=Fagus sylvatica TaxID=28930 RepID=A0A2N9IVJ8_FAGSY
MPQDRLRSAVYRSLVTCDDPKGIVDCKTIKKPRTGSQQMDHKIESQRTSKNSNMAMAYKAEKEGMVSKGFTEEVQSPSSFQLMKVSRGAQKLNHMIDSWSNGVRVDGQSKDIAKDLLKGALDLQDSLVMLGKLQEASLYMARVRKKPDEKSESRRIDEMGIKRTNSSTVGDQNFSMGFQKPRISADGSSRNHIEELKKKKEKGPNLIAKLMGLEDLPSKTSQNTLQKHFERERILNQQRPIFDIDMPKGRKTQSTAQKVDSERKTLREMLDTMQFIGLLSSNSVKELKPQSYHSSHSKQRLVDERPPIVLIKPFRVPCLVEQLHEPVHQEEEVLNTKKMLRKMKLRKGLSFNTHKEGALSSKKMHSKSEEQEEETPIKTLTIEEVVRKPEEKEVKSKEKTSRKLKASVPVDHRLQTKEAIEKKADKFQKVASASRKPLEMENMKGKIVSRSEDRAKLTSTKPRVSESGLNTVNNQILRQPSTNQNTSSNRATKTVISKSSDQKKTQMKKKKKKPIRELTAAKSIESFGSKEDDKSIDFKSEICPPLIRIDTTLVDELAIEEEKDASESHIGECCSNSQSFLSDVTPLSPKHEMDDKTVEEAYNDILHSRTDIKSFKCGSNFEALLLSCPLFLNHAEELFDLDVSSPTIFQTSGTNDFIVANVRLSLECANELIERKSVRGPQTVHPLLLTHVGNIRTSIDKLVEEVSNGVENLRSYSKLAGDCLTQDSLYTMLERDINCNGIENGIWDLSWRHGFSVDVAEQLVIEIEKLVFSGLIEEVVLIH